MGTPEQKNLPYYQGFLCPNEAPPDPYPAPYFLLLVLTCMGVLSADKAVKPTMSLK